MEPLDRHTFGIVLAIVVAAAVVCICFSLADEHSMDYSDADLASFVISEGDRLEYRVVTVYEGVTEEYTLEFVVKAKVNDSYLCDIVRYDPSGSYSDRYADVLVSGAVFSGDISELGQDLDLKKTKSAVHETEYAKLTCTRSKLSGDMVGFKTVVELIGLSGERPDTGTATLRIYDYKGHLTDYDLHVKDGEAQIYSMGFTLVGINDSGSAS